MPLKLAGLLTFWSELHLDAGTVREQELLTPLNQADAVILLLSADFFACQECLALMEQALQRQQKEGARVIPLLLRPVEWQESELGSLSYLPTSGVPVTRWPSQDEAFHVCLRELRSLLHIPLRSPRVPISGKKLSDKNRERMLRRLRRSYDGLVGQSLQGIAWMNLGLTERPNAVQNVTNLALQIEPSPAERPLPPGISIIQVYEDAEEELLILGEPGAGKSTELLDLAQHLVAQAEQDEGSLLPVILPLSSWAAKQGALTDWMVEQIAVAYDIPRKVSQQWVEGEQILPLLDGLDEMNEAARPACIAAINAYHRAHLTPLVVCSRTAEYESAANKARLALQSAVVIRPLTSKQVEETLKRAGEAVAGLQGALHQLPALQDLATTPLMLSVLILTYQGKLVDTSALNETDLERQIWTDYVQRMMDRKKPGNGKKYRLSQTCSWLGWLAQEMRLHNQAIFYAEQLQVNWLPRKLQQIHAWLALQVPAVIVGMLVGLLTWLFFYGSDPAFLFQAGLLGGFLGGWLNQSTGTSAVSLAYEPPENKRSSYVLVARLGNSLILGGLFGISFILDAHSFLSRPGSWLLEGLIAGIGFVLSGWILSWWLFCISQSSDSLSHSLTRLHIARWFSSVHLRRAVSVVLVWGVAFGLIFGLGYILGYGHRLVLNFGQSIGPASKLGIGMGQGLSQGLIFGFVGFLLSIVLDTTRESFRLAERLSWSGRHLNRLGHLRNSLLIGSLVCLILGPSVGLPVGLISGMAGDGLAYGIGHGLGYGFVFGLTYWLLFGLYQGIIQEEVETQDRQRFNQGIRRSLRNGILISLLGGG